MTDKRSSKRVYSKKVEEMRRFLSLAHLQALVLLVGARIASDERITRIMLEPADGTIPLRDNNDADKSNFTCLSGEVPPGTTCASGSDRCPSWATCCCTGDNISGA